MNFFQIIFLFSAFSLLYSQPPEDSIKTVILEIQTIPTGEIIIDSFINPLKNILYVLNNNQKLFIYNLTYIDSLNMSKTPISVFEFLNNSNPFMLSLFDDYQKMVVISEKTTNMSIKLIDFFDITNETSPTLIQSQEFVIFANISFESNEFEIIFSKNYDKLFLMNKLKGIIIFDIFPNKTLKGQKVEIFLQNCTKYILSKDETYIIYISDMTVNTINITDLSNISINLINSSILQIPVIYYQDFQITGITLSNQGDLLHILSCPDIWFGLVYTYNISNMESWNLADVSSKYFYCEKQGAIYFKLFYDKFLILSDYFGVGFLNYTNTENVLRINTYCDKILILSQNYILGQLNFEGEIRVYKLQDFDTEDIPTSFVNQINDVPEIPSNYWYWPDYIYVSIRFMVPLYDNYILIVHGGLFTIWTLDNPVHPHSVYSFYENSAFNWDIFEAWDNYVYNDPDSNYLLIYGRFLFPGATGPVPNLNMLIIYSKGNKTTDMSCFQTPKAFIYLFERESQYFRCMRIVSMNDIVYMMPFGYGDVKYHNMLVVDVSVDVPVLNFTNIEITEMSSVVGLAICQINVTDITDNITKLHKYIFYKVELDPYLYICEVNSSDYTNLIVIASILVKTSINDIKLSKDCNSLYMGGTTYLIIMNITNKTQPVIINQMKISDIFEIKILKNFLYINTASTTLKIDITDPFKPKTLLFAKFPYTHNPYVKGYESVIYEANDGISTYLYRSYTDNQANPSYKCPVSLLIERKNPLYVFLLNDDESYIGEPITYKYYVCLISDVVSGVDNAIKDIQMGDEFNQLYVVPLPSWISYNLELNEIYIKANKEYLTKKIVLIFNFDWAIFLDAAQDVWYGDPTSETIKSFKQVVIFPDIKATLDIIIDKDLKSLIINSPTQENLELNFTFSEKNNHRFIQDYFGGVYMEIKDIKDGVLTTTGILYPINLMLQKLRYSGENNSNFTLSINDQINEISINTYSLNLLKRNNPPIIKHNLQDQINNNVYFTPSLQFQFSMLSDTFIDDDNDILLYTSFDNPIWLNFDYKKLMLFGTPSLNDEGHYNLTIQVSDGYDAIYDTLSFIVYDEPPIINLNFSNVTAYIGRVNIFPFPKVIDNDGPSNLIYSFSIMSKQGVLIDSANNWLKLSTINNEFYGTPEITNFINENYLTIFLFASDSLKVTNASFYLEIHKCLSIDNLYIQSPTSLTQLRVSINSTVSKLLIPKKFQNEYLISWNTNENLTHINIVGESVNVNLALKELIFRTDKNVNNINEENLSIGVNDDVGESYEQSYDIMILKNDSNYTQINVLAHQYNEITIEIGNTYQNSLNKDIFIQENPNIQLNYTMILISNDDGLQKDFLQFSNFQIYSSKSIDSSLYGKYKLTLMATDEFLDKCTITININVDYSTYDKAMSGLKLAATFIGPIMSIIAMINYYYVVYNFFQRKNITIPSKNIPLNEKFKWKFPMIQQEYEISVKIKNHFIQLIKVNHSDLFQKFINDNKISPKNLGSYPEFFSILQEIPQYKYLPEQLIQTTECIVEGLLHAHLIIKLPNFHKIFEELIKETEKVLMKKNKKHLLSQWYNNFFIEFPKDQKSHIPLSTYAIQSGKFLVTEKHSFINFEIYEKFYSIIIKKYSKTNIEYKYFIMHGLILSKRGLLKNHNFIENFFNNLLSIIGLRIFSYRSGDSILADVDKVSNVVCLLKPLEGKWFSRPKAQFFSLYNKSVPNWMIIVQKKGTLIIQGEAPTYEKNLNYLFTISDHKNLKICEFWTVIKDSMEITKQKSEENFSPTHSKFTSHKSMYESAFQKYKTNYLGIKKVNDEKNLKVKSNYSEPDTNKVIDTFKNDEDNISANNDVFIETQNMDEKKGEIKLKSIIHEENNIKKSEVIEGSIHIDENIGNDKN